MAKTVNLYQVTCTRYRNGVEQMSMMVGTLPDLVQSYAYTLETGASYEHEKGNKKINRNPKSIITLVKNLNNAVNNAAANGYAGKMFTATRINA